MAKQLSNLRSYSQKEGDNCSRGYELPAFHQGLFTRNVSLKVTIKVQHGASGNRQ